MIFFKNCICYSFYFFICLALTVGLVLSSSYLYLNPQLPDPAGLKDTEFQEPLRIYSSDNKLIGEFGEKRRTPITTADTPSRFINALLSAEDDNFAHHIGIDFAGLARASLELITTGHIRTGGSTITMQVAKNFFLTREQTFERKFKEILLALRIENTLSKSEILELYLNKIFLGHRAYGFQAAAQVYYGRPLNQLSTAEYAMLAALPKAPSRLNPISNPERALTRRNWILKRMFSLGYIDETTYKQAIAAKITAQNNPFVAEAQAPYAAEMARQQVVSLYGNKAYEMGLRVYTSIDSKLQDKAQAAVIKGLDDYSNRHGYRPSEISFKQIDESLWAQKLQQLSNIGGHEPAIITSIEDKQLQALMKSGQTFTLEWPKLKNTRLYITENYTAEAPQTAQDVWQKGDLIYTKADSNGERQLSQIPKAQASLVAISPYDGAIRALSGGFDFNASKFNRATQAKRQPGSNFKPFIYAAALDKGRTAATVINDAPIVFEDSRLESTWRPENAGGRYFGPTRLRTALYRSRNLVSIRLLRETGIGATARYASKFGFDYASMPKDLSLALGSHAVTPLQIASSYAIFANQGFKITPYLISHIQDNNGEILYQHQAELACDPCSNNIVEEEQDIQEETFNENKETPAPKPPISAPRVIDPRIAYIIDSILKDVIIRGTGIRAKQLNRSDIAGKTGTTNGPADAWFSGYNSELVTTTWLGFDDNSLIGKRESGGSAALPIWIDFMAHALKDQPIKPRPRPPGLVNILIDKATGERARPGQTDTRFEIFLSEFTPPELSLEELDNHIEHNMDSDIF